MGSGCTAHSRGVDEAAFAVNKVTVDVSASMLLDCKEIIWFGADAAANLPVPLYLWLKEHEGVSRGDGPRKDAASEELEHRPAKEAWFSLP